VKLTDRAPTQPDRQAQSRGCIEITTKQGATRRIPYTCLVISRDSGPVFEIACFGSVSSTEETGREGSERGEPPHRRREGHGREHSGWWGVDA